MALNMKLLTQTSSNQSSPFNEYAAYDPAYGSKYPEEHLFFYKPLCKYTFLDIQIFR